MFIVIPEVKSPTSGVAGREGSCQDICTEKLYGLPPRSVFPMSEAEKGKLDTQCVSTTCNIGTKFYENLDWPEDQGTEWVPPWISPGGKLNLSLSDPETTSAA